MKATLKPITAKEKYLLAAIYGSNWAQMKGQYLAEALANVEATIKAAQKK